MTEQPGAPPTGRPDDVDRAGEKIGRIEDIFLVEETGRPEWALVKLGRIGGSATLVPLAGASPPTARSARASRSARSRRRRGCSGDGDPSEQQVNALYRHYGVDGPHEPGGARRARRSPAPRSGGQSGPDRLHAQAPSRSSPTTTSRTGRRRSRTTGCCRSSPRCSRWSRSSA